MAYIEPWDSCLQDPGRLRQEDCHMFEASLSYIKKFLKKWTNKTKQKNPKVRKIWLVILKSVVCTMDLKYMLFSILKYGFVTKQLFDKGDGIKFN